MTDANNILLHNEAFEPNRARVDIDIGAIVQRGEIVYRISQVLDFESVIGLALETGRSTTLRIGELRPVSSPSLTTIPSMTCDVGEIVDEDWRMAEQRFAAIKPLIEQSMNARADVQYRAKEIGVHTATLYRWLQRYKAYGVVAALVPHRRGWKEGRGRISGETEKVIEQVIQDIYLTSQRSTAQKVVDEVKTRCIAKGIEPPGPSTIRARISSISERDQLRARGFKDKAKNKFQAAPGSFPNADYPLAVIQIDHTPADIILVDDIYRKPIGRPWITLAMDVFSRMITGYYLSFDPPSETSVAMCVAHSILPKDDWMLLHKVGAEWPVWGKPRTIHVDNGADFRSNNFQQSCVMHGISLEFRPVKQPRYGGHIERVLGTLLREIHDLPGTTFSSIKNREGYDSEKHAAMTKSEFEEWLVTLICKVYHRRLHTNIHMTPYRKWEIGIFGSTDNHGVGVPPRPVDRLTILLDFLPASRRTVQHYGVTIDDLTYFAEALRPWINSSDSKTGEKRKFTFRRDPRDISSIWFFDPMLKQYYKIPTANQAFPAMSVWEYRLAKEKLKQEGIASVNEHQVLRAITEMRNHVALSQEKTKKARRQAQRRREHEKNISPANPLPANSKIESEQPIAAFLGLFDGDIDAFGDIS